MSEVVPCPICAEIGHTGCTTAATVKAREEREDREQANYERGYGDAVDELTDFFLERAEEAVKMRKRVKFRDSKLRHDGVVVAMQAVIKHLKMVQEEVHGEEGK